MNSVAAALALALSACNVPADSEPGGPVTGARGVLGFEVEPAAPVAEGSNDFVLHVTGLAGRSADVSLRVLMPAMGHASEAPSAVETGPGEFTLHGVVFDMPGAWALRVRVAEPGATDSLDEAELTFEVP